MATWTTPGDSSPERRHTAGILNALLSAARSPKLTEAGSPNTAPNRKLAPGRISQRKNREAEVRGLATALSHLDAPTLSRVDSDVRLGVHTPRTREKAVALKS